MKINENLNLILRDTYLYDIEACHYTILKNLGYDLTGIEKDNKLQRNIQIGQMMRKNPKLTSLLRSTTNSIIDEYILRNNIEDDDIVIRQYDGIITVKRLQETKLHQVPLDIRKHFEIFISSYDRSRYIALDSNKEVTIKGIPSRYERIDDLYKKICLINFANKLTIFSRLQQIKDDLLTSSDPWLFAIPMKNGKFNIYLKGYGELEISKQTIKIMDVDDIDKIRYFDFYLKPFTKSIVIEFVR